jgi:hypothetical protein
MSRVDICMHVTTCTVKTVNFSYEHVDTLITACPHSCSLWLMLFTFYNFKILINYVSGWYYTGCPRRNVPNSGKVFLMLNYTDINQNTCIQSWTVREIMAIEKCGHLAFPRTVRLQLLRIDLDSAIQSSLSVVISLHAEWTVASFTEFQICLLCFPTWNIAKCI